MKKFQTRGFILGVVVTLVFCSTCMASFASFVNKTITVQTGIKVYNDDKLINATDAQGNIVEPLMYNGTTYLPVRAVASAVNKAVVYDPKTQSVYLGTHDSDTPAIMLTSLKPYKYENESNLKAYTNVKDTEGYLYSKVLRYWSYYDQYRPESSFASASYIVDGAYRKIKGTIFIFGDNTNVATSSVILRIYGDDKLLYTSDEFESGMKPIKFDVDIEGVTDLKCELVSLKKARGWEYFGLGDVGLYQ